MPPFRPLLSVANINMKRSFLLYGFDLERRLENSIRIRDFLNIDSFNMTLTEISSFERIEQKYQLPDLPNEYLEVIIIDNDDVETEETVESYPLAISEVSSESILDAKRLTDGDDVKEVYSLMLSSNFSSYKPGDTISIITQNRDEDLQKLFSHLGITHLAMKKCKVCEKTPTEKKNPAKPSFLDKVTTLEEIFKFSLDIHTIPKKSLIRVLAEFTSDLDERNHLHKLCSKEGSDDYVESILNVNKTFLDLMLMFPSCRPPVARLIENLPKLLPRPYSIASSPLVSANEIRIVFSVIEIENGSRREGLCTGMLKSLINRNDIEERKVKMFFRKCNGFNLPDSEVPLILIGPGTGIAPFIGFLEHRRALKSKGKVWLFYGCRHKSKDYLFREELEEFCNCGVLTKLSVAFSRDSDSSAKYVQDNIRKNGKEICDLIFEENAIIYVCGDATNMRKDVLNAFADVIQVHKGMTNAEALNMLKKFQKERRYLQDIWF